MTKLSWRSERRQISELTPAAYNPRMMTEKQASDLSTSIDKFDLADPLVINADNKLIGGHQRLTILKSKGIIEVDVRVPSRQLTEKEEQELNIRLNKNLGQWDFDALANFDEDMLKDIVFDSKELDKIFQIDTTPEDDAIPENAPAICNRGEIYQLGRHRLMCGDSTSASDVAVLMDGKKSAMIHTDPPYNVDYGVSKNPRDKIRTIENDKQSPEEWEAFCKSLFEIFKCFNDGDIYMWGAPGPEGMRMRLWLVESGAHWSATIIWKKQQLVLSPAKYQRMYEPCFYGWFDKSSFGDSRTETEVWDINRPLDSKLHPTMKPVELCEKAIINSSKRDDVVLDLFLGSGSTLIACEKSNRICYGMEIDPKYCDVIIKRWEDFYQAEGNKDFKRIRHLYNMASLWVEKRRKSIHAVLQSLKKGTSINLACTGAKIDVASFWMWRKKYPRLERLVEAIYDSRILVVEDSLYKNCVSGNFAAQAYFLNNRHKLKWKNPDAIKVVQQTVVQNHTEKMTDEQFIEYCRKEGVAIPPAIEARLGGQVAEKPA